MVRVVLSLQIGIASRVECHAWCFYKSGARTFTVGLLLIITQSEVPWCFYKSGALPSQCKLNGPRFDCGNYTRFPININFMNYFVGVVGTDEQQCKGRGCCWDPKDVCNQSRNSYIEFSLETLHEL